jgi:hypothetical protein
MDEDQFIPTDEQKIILTTAIVDAVAEAIATAMTALDVDMCYAYTFKFENPSLIFLATGEHHKVGERNAQDEAARIASQN